MTNDERTPRMFDHTRAEMVTGVFVLVGLLGLGYLSISIGGVRILPRDEYRISARFSNVGDLKVRAPVKIAGVTIGRVQSIHLANYYAEAELAVARNVILPKDTIASIATAGLLGDAYVALSPGGERSFSFARKPGADTQFRAEEINEAAVKNTKILHVGSLSLTDEPARSATYHAVALAKGAGAVISYDPNYRSSLWPDCETAIRQMRAMLPNADMIKLSDDEAKLLTGITDPAESALRLNHMGISCVAVTLGAKGALVCVRRKTAAVPGYAVPVVDTTGAGDAFWGAFLNRLLESGKTPADLTLEGAVSCARWGNAAAALCIGKRGAIPAMSDLKTLSTFSERF
jgi:sugar/nucleoside kinase (ribokinase family)